MRSASRATWVAPARRHMWLRQLPRRASHLPGVGLATVGKEGRSSTGRGLDELDHLDSLDSAELRDELLKPGRRSFRDEDLKAIRFVEVGVKHRADFIEAVLEHREVRAWIPLFVDDREDDRGVPALPAPFRDIDELPQGPADRFAPAPVLAPLGDVLPAAENGVVHAHADDRHATKNRAPRT